MSSPDPGNHTEFVEYYGIDDVRGMDDAAGSDEPEKHGFISKSRILKPPSDYTTTTRKEEEYFPINSPIHRTPKSQNQSTKTENTSSPSFGSSLIHGV